MTKKYNITAAQAKVLYITMKDINDILLSNGIGYWVTGGSLIGAIRHRGIVPWDDDGDICIMRKDVPKLRALIPAFEKKGYDISEDDDEESDCSQKKHSCTWFIESNRKHSLGVDVFVMEQVGPLITYSDPYWRDADNGGLPCYFLTKFVFPLVPVRFGNFWVMTPFNAIEHLNQCYGDNWNSHSRRLYDHREGKWIDSKPKRMLAPDYETIPPPRSTCETRPPSVPCKARYAPRANIKNLTPAELKIVGKVFGIKGASKMSLAKLREAVKKVK